jgi:hypothetical protein
VPRVRFPPSHPDTVHTDEKEGMLFGAKIFILRYNMRILIELFFKFSRYSWAFTEKLGLAGLTDS